MRLMNQVAVVTGAAVGMGRPVAQRFAGEGARVVAVDIDTRNGEAVVEGIRHAGGDAIFVRADVSQEGEVKRRCGLGEGAQSAGELLTIGT